MEPDLSEETDQAQKPDLTEKEILHRSMIEDDFPYLIHSWMASYHDTESIREHTLFEDYKVHQQAICSRLLKTQQVTILCPEDTPDLILAWSCHSPMVLHFAYVKLPFRRMGLYTRLLHLISPIRFYSHMPRNVYRKGKREGDSYKPGMTHGLHYSPYAAMIPDWTPPRTP